MMGRAVTPAEYTADQKREAQAIAEVERTVTNIQNYKRALEESPEMEMRSILNALAGGYVAPTSTTGWLLCHPTGAETQEDPGEIRGLLVYLRLPFGYP